MNSIISKTLFDLDGERTRVRSHETNLGNLIADAMLNKAGCARATIAIVNSGSIRASIPNGDISMGQVMAVLPFDDYLVYISGI